MSDYILYNQRPDNNCEKDLRFKKTLDLNLEAKETDFYNWNGINPSITNLRDFPAP